MSVIIKDIRRNDREIIRIEVSEFKGRDLINLRIWYQAVDERGNVVYKPTQKGVALDVSNYAELLDGVERIGNYLKDREAGVNPLGE
ncbi:MAG TPA: transcriptional coactivator p15/PC4 family protein [Spirochaetota bacterium]|nr:transcriptional coactivator p15/PC4 family protein [Spirochaetota bacterium]HNT09715.1 transcriptional coactivator p15/PC4 family protein [Spirochaetota bacterium]HNV45642.1 transcriptional coactivator p15/PC4 family protein [Spirochaetota bacterium]HOS39196.1 transcriptional coactivator p15/PC4 family protein [Spirochaetota bacterium]HPI21684.1 transcriptional coactivator p15/PC4 family protein [Spirochaetota bacterium]